MYIILNETETVRIGIDNLCLADQNEIFGLSYYGFYDRHFDNATKRYHNRWGYIIVDKHKLMLSVIKHGIIIDLFLNNQMTIK